MVTLLHILKIVIIVAVAFFVITFGVYFFNIDMKMTSMLFPFFEKHYDKVKRDKHL